MVAAAARYVVAPLVFFNVEFAVWALLPSLVLNHFHDLVLVRFRVFRSQVLFAVSKSWVVALQAEGTVLSPGFFAVEQIVLLLLLENLLAIYAGTGDPLFVVEHLISKSISREPLKDFDVPVWKYLPQKSFGQYCGAISERAANQNLILTDFLLKMWEQAAQMKGMTAVFHGDYSLRPYFLAADGAIQLASARQYARPTVHLGSLG